IIIYVLILVSNSISLARPVFHPCVYRDPVYFPGLAAIGRECLFKSARIWSDVGYNKSNKDGAPIKHFLVVQLASASFETADCRLAQSTALAVCKIKAPLTGLRIVQTQAQGFETT